MLGRCILVKVHASHGIWATRMETLAHTFFQDLVHPGWCSLPEVLGFGVESLSAPLTATQVLQRRMHKFGVLKCSLKGEVLSQHRLNSLKWDSSGPGPPCSWKRSPIFLLLIELKTVRVLAGIAVSFGEVIFFSCYPTFFPKSIH